MSLKGPRFPKRGPKGLRFSERYEFEGFPWFRLVSGFPWYEFEGLKGPRFPKR